MLAERVRLIRRAFDRKDNRYADVCALADEIERLALDGLAGEVPAHVCKCENGPCPKCGGGPSGEWFEGHEVTCDDCGAELVVATIEECHGRSTFELIEYHDEPTEEGQP